MGVRLKYVCVCFFVGYISVLRADVYAPPPLPPVGLVVDVEPEDVQNGGFANRVLRAMVGVHSPLISSS